MKKVPKNNGSGSSFLHMAQVSHSNLITFNNTAKVILKQGIGMEYIYFPRKLQFYLYRPPPFSPFYFSVKHNVIEENISNSPCSVLPSLSLVSVFDQKIALKIYNPDSMLQEFEFHEGERRRVIHSCRSTVFLLELFQCCCYLSSERINVQHTRSDILPK